MALAALVREQILINDVKKVGNIWRAVTSLSYNCGKKPVSKRPAILTQSVVELSTSSRKLSQGGGGHDHSTLWKVERVVAIGLFGLIPAAITTPNQALDTLLALALTMHMHWGLESVAHDYIRKIVFGPVIPKLATALVYILSVVTLAGLLNLSFNDVGIGNTVRMFWKL